MIFPEVGWAAIAPELVLVIGAVLVLLVDVQWKPDPRVLAWGAVLALLCGTILSLGLWFGLDNTADITRPFGGMIAHDRFAALSRLVIYPVTALGVAGGWRLWERLGRRTAEGLALVLLSAVGFGLMGVSVHLVLIFLGLEIGSLSLYVLVGITRERPQADEAGLKYFLLGSFASALFIYGVALLFAGTGSFDLVAQRQFLVDNVVTHPAVLLAGLGLVTVGLGFKVSAAPFHSWAPDVYQGAPAGVVGIAAAVAKLGGFLALARVFYVGFDRYIDDWSTLLSALAALSMIIGVGLAVVQDDLRRMLAYSGVAHAGFLLLGLVSGAGGQTEFLFYLSTYAVQLVAGFGVVAVMSDTGTGTPLDRFRGLATRSPGLALGMAAAMLGMAGIPLTSGFVAKFGVMVNAWESGYGWLVLVGVIASVVGFAFYLRVVVVMFMNQPTIPEAPSVALPTRVMIGAAGFVTLALGIFPAPWLEIASNAFSV